MRNFVETFLKTSQITKFIIHTEMRGEKHLEYRISIFWHSTVENYVHICVENLFWNYVLGVKVCGASMSKIM